MAMFGIWVLATPVSGMGFAYGLGRFLKSGIRVLLCRPSFLQVGFSIQGWVGIWWIPPCAGYAFRLWFALVGRFFETPFSGKRRAIEMIEMTEMIEMIDTIEMIHVPVPAGSPRGATRRDFDTETKPNRPTTLTWTGCRNIGTFWCFPQCSTIGNV